MRKTTLVVLSCILIALMAAGCGGDTSTEPEVDPEELYEQLETGMSMEDTYAVMEGFKPFTETEATTETPIGTIEMKTTSWKVGKHLITVIFENKILQSKSISEV